MEESGKYRLLIAGGKTGGHLFPGIAVARRFMAKGQDHRVVFVGTKEGLEARVLPREKLPLIMVHSSGIRGKGISGAIKGMALAPVAMLQSARAVISYRPHVALGVGGFVSGPVILAAWMLRIPTAIQEQNAVPGWTNRILGRFVDVVFASFEESGRYFPAKKLMIVGNPVRDDVINPPNAEPELHLENLNPDLRTLLVFGGSQGARPINRAVVDFLRSNPTLRDRLNLIHQCGSADLEDVQHGYRDMGYKAIVVPFIHRMGEAYAAADLVIARAGAGTVFELMALSKPSVLIPFPEAAGDHQTFNAMALAGKGAAVMVRQAEIADGALSRALKELLANHARLKEMSERARALACVGASEIIAQKLHEMVEKNKSRDS